MPPKRRGVRGKQAKANADFSGNEGTPEDEVALALAMATVERLTKQYTNKSPNDGVTRGSSIPGEEVSEEESKARDKENSVPCKPKQRRMAVKSKYTETISDSKKASATEKERTPEIVSSGVSLRITKVRDGCTRHAKTTNRRESVRTRARSSITDSSISSSNSSSNTSEVSRHALHETPNSAESSPSDFKIPQPILGQSTPSRNSRELDDSLYGFRDLQSPPTLSPITRSPMIPPKRSCSPADGVPVAPSAQRLYGTCSLPSRPSRRPKSRSKKQHQAEMEQWVQKMNAEFAEIDQVELNII